MAATNGMMDVNDAVMLLIDHQAGLFQLVRDIDHPTLRSHAVALAKVARLGNIPSARKSTRKRAGA